MDVIGQLHCYAGRLLQSQRSLLAPLTVIAVIVATSMLSHLSWAGPGPREGVGTADRSAQLYARGDLNGAVKVLRQAINTRPQDAQLHFMLANALFRQRGWLGAIHHYSEAAHLRAQHPDTYLGLGHACYQAGQMDEAVAAWRTAVRQSPGDALPHLSLAVGLNAQGRVVEARQHIAVAVDLDPGWRRRISIDVRWTHEMVREVSSLVDLGYQDRER